MGFSRKGIIHPQSVDKLIHLSILLYYLQNWLHYLPSQLRHILNAIR